MQMVSSLPISVDYSQGLAFADPPLLPSADDCSELGPIEEAECGCCAAECASMQTMQKAVAFCKSLIYKKGLLPNVLNCNKK